MENLKEKLYDYNYLELVAIKYGIKCAEYATIGMNEMPSTDILIPEIIEEIEREEKKYYETHEKDRKEVGCNYQSTNYSQARCATNSEGEE